MTDIELLNIAKDEMKDFADYVVNSLQEFADNHDYEFAWCVDRFRTAFAAALKRQYEQKR